MLDKCKRNGRNFINIIANITGYVGWTGQLNALDVDRE